MTAIVTLPLPVQLANGTVADATQVMTDLNYLATQINTNAQPLGAATSANEWQASGFVPTFISTTSFSVPGDQTGTFLPGGKPGRRLQTTNTGGTTYSTVITAVFGGGITTVTVVNTSGVLDAGLSVVNYAIISPSNNSLPLISMCGVLCNNSQPMATLTTYVLGGSTPFPTTLTFNDTFSEMSSGVFTAKTPGLYLAFAYVRLNRNGATITSNGSLQINTNGILLSPFFAPLTTPDVNNQLFSSTWALLQGNFAGFNASAQLVSTQFTGGPMQSLDGAFGILRVR